MKKKIYYLSLLLIIFTVLLDAQNNLSVHDIKGYIKDSKSGEMLPYASVSIPGTKRGTTANQSGYFILADVPLDTITLIINYIGYSTQTIKYDNKSGENKPITIQMNPVAVEMKGITITANAEMLKINDQVSQITMSPRQIVTLPNIGEVDIFRSLQLLPGINAGSKGSSELYIRGGTPDQNLILFDGMTIYHVDHFFGFFSAFNADAIKDVQVYKGGFPAEFGGRISSVVNLTGKSGDENKTRFKLGLNLLSGHASLEIPVPIFEQSTFLIAFRRSYTDFIQSSLYDKIYQFVTGDASSGRAGTQTDLRGMGRGPGAMSNQLQPTFYFYDLNSKLTMSFSENEHLKLSFYSGKDNLDQSQDFGSFSFRIPNQDATDQTSTNLSVGDFTKWGNLGMSGNWNKQWSDRFNTDLIAAYSQYFSNYNRTSNFNQPFMPNRDSASIRRGFATATKEDNTVDDFSFRINANWQISQSHKIGFGVWITQLNTYYSSSLNDTTILLHNSNKSLQNSFYIQDKWQINNFELLFGLRSTYYQKTSEVYNEPRFSFTYSLFDEMKIKGAWGKYYQFVNRITNENVLEGNRDFWLTADENLRPSSAEDKILGASYENNDYILSVESYLKDYNNLLQYSRRFNGIADYQNRFFFGTGKAKGIEFLLQKKTGDLTGWIGYTLSKVEYQFPKINDGISYPAEQDHLHDFKVVAKYTLDEWNFSAVWLYATGNAYTAPESQYFIKLLDGQSISYIHVSDKNTNRLPDFHRLDLSVSRHFNIDFADTEVGLSIFNVYNQKNIYYKQYNLATTPVTVTDVLQLGFMPTLFVQFNFN